MKLQQLALGATLLAAACQAPAPDFASVANASFAVVALQFES